MTDLKEVHGRVCGTIKDVCTWKDGEVYILLAFARKKNNPELQSTTDYRKPCIFREIITESNYEEKTWKLLLLMSSYEYDKVRPQDFNLYLTVNPRNLRKALRNLKDKLNEWEMLDEHTPLYHFQAHWLSSLQKKSARSRKEYFLVDVDSKDMEVYDAVFDALFEMDNIPKTFETRNGYHFVARPFDHKKFFTLLNQKYHEFVEVKTDDCLQLWHTPREN